MLTQKCVTWDYKCQGPAFAAEGRFGEVPP
jgi:hypothetical protein